jgi:hypothetical protein
MAPENCTWNILLEQATDLSVIRGSAAELAAALRRAGDLRAFLDPGPYQETLYFQQTYVGAADHVAGIMTHHHAFKFEGKPAEQPYISLIKCDPSGQFSVVKWMLGDRVFDVSDMFPYPYKIYRWIVCDRWRLAYEHDAAGNRVAGDLADLREAVERGWSVRVGIRQFFGLADGGEPGPEHISFLTVVQPILEAEHVLASCDVAVSGPPRWPFAWKHGVHFGFVQPSTSGEMICYVAKPGELPFQRIVPRRGMQWFVSPHA